MKNHYEILGLEANATSEDIRKAYRKLSVKFHPDKNEGDAYFSAMFRQVNEAYTVLSDPQKRMEYDRLRRNPVYDQTKEAQLRQREIEIYEREQEVIREREQILALDKETKEVEKLMARPTLPWSGSLNIRHLKYFLWVVICLLVYLIGSRPKADAQEESLPKQTHIHTMHRKRKHRQATQRTDSTGIAQLKKPTVEQAQAKPDTATTAQSPTFQDTLNR
jgi:curved DNA-binding protein CbpA